MTNNMEYNKLLTEFNIDPKSLIPIKESFEQNAKSMPDDLFFLRLFIQFTVTDVIANEFIYDSDNFIEKYSTRTFGFMILGEICAYVSENERSNFYKKFNMEVFPKIELPKESQNKSLKIYRSYSTIFETWIRDDIMMLELDSILDKYKDNSQFMQMFNYYKENIYEKN